MKFEQPHHRDHRELQRKRLQNKVPFYWIHAGFFQSIVRRNLVEPIAMFCLFWSIIAVVFTIAMMVHGSFDTLIILFWVMGIPSIAYWFFLAFLRFGPRGLDDPSYRELAVGDYLALTKANKKLLRPLAAEVRDFNYDPELLQEYRLIVARRLADQSKAEPAQTKTELPKKVAKLLESETEAWNAKQAAAARDAEIAEIIKEKGWHVDIE